MARPTKQGIDYFPMDCEFDSKTKMYLLETEADGLAVLVALWQIIYSDEGYYTKYNPDLNLLIKDKVKIDIKIIDECIHKAIARELFNPKLFKKYNILTSNGIQKRFFEISKRKKIVKVYKNYILKDIELMENVSVIDEISVDPPPKKSAPVVFKFKGIDDKPISRVKLSQKDWDNLITKTSLNFAKQCVQKLDGWYKDKKKAQYGDDNLKMYRWVIRAVKEDMERDTI